MEIQFPILGGQVKGKRLVFREATASSFLYCQNRQQRKSNGVDFLRLCLSKRLSPLLWIEVLQLHTPLGFSV